MNLTALAAAERVTTPGAGQRPWMSVVTHLDPRFGGLSAVVPQLSASVAAETGRQMNIAAFCSPGELYAPSANAQVSLSEWPASRLRWFREPALRESFEQEVETAAGVHIHGLWEQSTAVACRLAKKHRKPYLISAHGMLEAWALKNKGLKKLVYAALLERRNLNGASCLHALTAAEAEDYRRFGCTAPIAIIPNGVRIPERVSAEAFLSMHPPLRGKRIVLFLGRLHHKKGLSLLVEAWANVSRRHPDAHLVLAGPDFEGTRAQIVQQIVKLGLGDRILLTGMLRDELKWSALAAAECFVLPSFSEGLSVSVLEAMGIGKPVIVSSACNLPEVATIGAGWVIEAKVEQLQGSLDEMLGQSATRNRDIGAAGKGFVRDRYSWQTVAKQMGEVYDWLDTGRTPLSVDIVSRAGDRR